MKPSHRYRRRLTRYLVASIAVAFGVAVTAMLGWWSLWFTTVGTLFGVQVLLFRAPSRPGPQPFSPMKQPTRVDEPGAVALIDAGQLSRPRDNDYS